MRPGRENRLEGGFVLFRGFVGFLLVEKLVKLHAQLCALCVNDLDFLIFLNFLKIFFNFFNPKLRKRKRVAARRRVVKFKTCFVFEKSIIRKMRQPQQLALRLCLAFLLIFLDFSIQFRNPRLRLDQRLVKMYQSLRSFQLNHHSRRRSTLLYPGLGLVKRQA